MCSLGVKLLRANDLTRFLVQRLRSAASTCSVYTGGRVPVGVLLGRIASGTLGRWIAATGVAAAVVQVIGLSRWVLFVPGISDDAAAPGTAVEARRTFERLHTWLGEFLGETIGYALTATFTILVAAALAGAIAPAWLTLLGYGSGALIATGVLIPLGLDAASITNFVRYVIWCLWLIAMAVSLWRSTATMQETSTA